MIAGESSSLWNLHGLFNADDWSRGLDETGAILMKPSVIYD
jgi:hypothetical protein